MRGLASPRCAPSLLLDCLSPLRVMRRDIGRTPDATSDMIDRIGLAADFRVDAAGDAERILAHAKERTWNELEMPGNPREIITMAERRFPVRIRIAVPPDGLGRRHASNNRLARRELWRRWLGDDAGRIARRDQRCGRHLLLRCGLSCGLRLSLVRRIEGRDKRRSIPGAQGSADASRSGQGA